MPETTEEKSPTLAQLAQCRRDLERDLDTAIRTFLAVYKLEPSQVRVVWGPMEVRMGDGQPRPSGYGVLVGVTL